MSNEDFVKLSPKIANVLLHYLCPVFSLLSFIIFERGVFLKNKELKSIQEWIPIDEILENGIIKLKKNNYIKIIKIIKLYILWFKVIKNQKWEIKNMR